MCVFATSRPRFPFLGINRVPLSVLHLPFLDVSILIANKYAIEPFCDGLLFCLLRALKAG